MIKYIHKLRKVSASDRVDELLMFSRVQAL